MIVGFKYLFRILVTLICSVFVCFSLYAVENKSTGLNIKSTSPLNINLSQGSKHIENKVKVKKKAEESTKIGSIVSFRVLNNQGEDESQLEFIVTKKFNTEVKVINFPFTLMFDIPRPYQWKVSDKMLNNSSVSKAIFNFYYGNLGNQMFRVMANLKFPIRVDKAFLFPIKNKGSKKYKFVINVKSASKIESLLNSSTLVVPTTAENYLSLQRASDSRVTKSKIKTEQMLALNQWLKSYLNNVKYPTPYLSKSKGRIVVAIDPGHGGKDPGAMTAFNSSIKEKNIVLSISKYVVEFLAENPEISTFLIRRGDYFVPLKDRILWARQFNSDLFVSIHADRAASGSSRGGMSVYTLSEKASDIQAQLIANQENKSDLIAGFDIDSSDNNVSKIIISLLQRVKINDSVTLAKDILTEASREVKLLRNPLRSAGFVVLKVPDTPSVLVETGFLSNKRDIKNLTDPVYQKTIAKRIAIGIQKYLWVSGKLKLPPSGI